VACGDSDIIGREILGPYLAAYGAIEPVQVRFLGEVDNLGHETVRAGVSSQDAC